MPNEVESDVRSTLPFIRPLEPHFAKANVNDIPCISRETVIDGLEIHVTTLRNELGGYMHR